MAGGDRHTRATFTTEAESLSRSGGSIDRGSSMDDRRARAGQRTGSFSTPSKSQNVHIPAQIYEEPATPDGTEEDPFLASNVMETAAGRSSMMQTPRGLARLRSMSYHTFGAADPQARYLQLNQPDGRLIRNASIFKLSGMIDDKGGQFEKYRKSDEELKKMKKPIRQYYEDLNDLLDAFAEVDEILDNTQALAATGELAPLIPNKPSAKRVEEHYTQVRLAINVNFIINFLLLVAKILVVILSRSMSLIASTVDSAMDFLSTIIIYGTSKVIAHRSWKSLYLFPTGKQRMEPLGVCIFAVFMISSFIQVFIESVQRIFDKDLAVARIPLIGKIVMVTTIAVKAGVWLWCRTIRNSSVEALTQDAENDIVFNFFSLLFPFIGEQLGWRYLDPIGGAVLSVYIVIEWTSTLFENVSKLTGRRASPAEHQRVAYLITRFSPLIKGIQHLSVYHTGDSLIVEVDIVLPPSTDLTIAHNIGESAQYGLEQLDGVDRAFVHLDVTANPLSGHVIR